LRLDIGLARNGQSSLLAKEKKMDSRIARLATIISHLSLAMTQYLVAIASNRHYDQKQHFLKIEKLLLDAIDFVTEIKKAGK